MPNQPRDQVNGRSLAGAYAGCELRLNTVVVLRGAPGNGGPFSLGQSYAQTFPKPSRPVHAAQAWLTRATRRICNNQTGRRANQLRGCPDPETGRALLDSPKTAAEMN
ncbi:hypothetical protein BRAS3809_5470011 [Bradyrhizobium sp. STM 3809]|nr:hypothetical protein BRAS3809_5470011 [Bradyrhizobium sp. STM 3809]